VPLPFAISKFKSLRAVPIFKLVSIPNAALAVCLMILDQVLSPLKKVVVLLGVLANFVALATLLLRNAICSQFPQVVSPVLLCQCNPFSSNAI